MSLSVTMLHSHGSHWSCLVPVCLSKGLVWQVFPLHDNVSLESLQAGWVRKLFGLQPLGIYWYFSLPLNI